ncbi:MAG: hypothetical protein ACO3F3_16555 [Gemmataceae bacterium]
MPAQIYSTGPVHIFAGHKEDAASAGVYLGTCEKSPIVSIEYLWGEVINDLGGLAPVDMIFRGITAKIGLSLNRFNEDKIMQFQNNQSAITNRAIAATIQPGEYDALQMGGLTEIGFGSDSKYTRGYWLALKFGFGPADQNITAYSGLPSGYWFPSVVIDSFNYEQVGTRHKKLALEISAHPQTVTAADAAPNSRGMTSGVYFNRIYSTTWSGFSTLPQPN